jgi:hypothetical protein
MLPPGMPPRKSGATARLQHQAFFEALQHGEGTRDWAASRAGLIVLRFVLARSDAEWEPGALADEEGRVSAAVGALPADDPEHVALEAILRAVAAAFRSTSPIPMHADAARAPHPAEPVADALVAYGDALAARSAWPLAADVYATVWDTRAAPDTRFGGGVDPRDAEEAPEGPALRSAPRAAKAPVRHIAAASALAALRLASCYRMMSRPTDAADALLAAKAAAAQCRDATIGEYTGFRARLGEALLLLDAGLSPKVDRALAVLVAESAGDPRLRDVHALARHAQAVAAYRRQRGSR